MQSPERHSERLTALFMFGVVVFSPLVLSIFDVGAEIGVLGVPVLYLYVFTAWGVLIALLRLTTRNLPEDTVKLRDSEPTVVDERRTGP